VARADRPARLRIGTSGFSHSRWRGLFYPRDLAPGGMLRHYASVLDCVEIGFTTDRLPAETVLTGWRRQTPAGFAFVLKAPKRVTHEGRLGDPIGVLDDFAARTAALGSKLAAVLFQTPPHLHADAARLDAFLAALPRGLVAVLELRHPSWFDEATYAVLRHHRATLCVTDTAEGTTPLVATAPLGYVRLRRDDYDDDALAGWIARLRAVAAWRRVFVFVKHDEVGRAGVLARRLRALSGAAPA
jgi:uncharacterized protein YecE (DUF72 family)